MVMKVDQEKVWAGTEASLKAAVEAEESIAKRMAAGDCQDEEDDDERPRLLEVSDGVAVISIKGSLNNESGPWNRYFGMTGYPEIREALINAANDPEVKEILLDIDSGGGAVSGVADTANLVRMVNDHVKPVSTFTDGTMASAAYWIGASAGKVFAGRTAVVGSIGVLSTHREYSQALKEAGVGVTVIRAGKYKALANSVEPLSEAGRKQIQQVVDAAYKVFVEHVASMRGKSYDYTDQSMAQGQEFVGESAADVGLVDSITTFDDVVGQLKARSIDASNNFMENRGKPKLGLVGAGGTDFSGEPDMKKKALTEQDIAAIAAGGQVLSAEAAADVEATAAEVVEPGQAADTTADTDTSTSGQVEKTGAAEANVDTSAAAVQLLKEQLASRDDALLQANIKLAKLEEAQAALKATHDPLLAIACKAVSHLHVALGGSAPDMTGASAAHIVAEHQRLSEQFVAKFKAGGVAAVSTPDSSKNEQATKADALTQARLAAVRLNRKGA